ncbi:MAG: nicotinate (nicotinamide) nucleotide adenylyltransferase [Breznakia sp.]
MKKIALLGGSFDPVHDGHVEIAKAARKQLSVDEVWFVLSAITPLKKRQLSAYHHRYQMLKRALHKYKKFKICTIEKGSTEANYTVDTIRKLKRKHPKNKFYFLFGADQVAHLHEWKDIDILSKQITLCVVKRNTYQLTSSYKLRPIEMKEVNISSSEIRSGALAHLHPKVKQYMMEHMLYPEMLRKWMSEKRYEHSVRVAKFAQEIARNQHLDPYIAYMGGFYHDIHKEDKMLSRLQSVCVLKQLKPALLHQPETLWHGYIGRFVCSHYFLMQHKKVLKAIEHHVLAESFGVYEQLLFVADKLEIGRSHTKQEQRLLANKDIRRSFKEVKQQQMLFYEKE